MMTFYKRPQYSKVTALDVVARLEETQRRRVFTAAMRDMMEKLVSMPPAQDYEARAVYGLLVAWMQHPLCPAELLTLAEMFILDRSVQATRCGVIWAKNQTKN